MGTAAPLLQTRRIQTQAGVMTSQTERDRHSLGFPTKVPAAWVLLRFASNQTYFE